MICQAENNAVDGGDCPKRRTFDGETRTSKTAAILATADHVEFSSATVLIEGIVF